MARPFVVLTVHYIALYHYIRSCRVKTLSVKQPWAALLCAGVKDVENRSWKIAHRGTLLIHASAQEDRHTDLIDLLRLYGDMQKITRDQQAGRPDASECVYLQNNRRTGKLELRRQHRGDQYLQAEYTFLRRTLDDPDFNPFDIGAVIGSVDVVNVITDSPSPWAVSGQYNWILANPVLFDDPISNVRGRLKIWEFPIHNYRQ